MKHADLIIGARVQSSIRLETHSLPPPYQLEVSLLNCKSCMSPSRRSDGAQIGGLEVAVKLADIIVDDAVWFAKRLRHQKASRQRRQHWKRADRQH